LGSRQELTKRVIPQYRQNHYIFDGDYVGDPYMDSGIMYIAVAIAELRQEGVPDAA